MNNWQETQIQALIAAGVDAADAQASVAFVEHCLYPGVDPATYLPEALMLAVGLTQDFVQDARIAWFASDDVPAKFKRILDATEVSE